MIINAECGCKVGDKIYSVMREMPILFSYDRKSSKVDLIGMLSGEKPFLISSSRKIISWNDKLIIVPYNAVNIHIFDLGSGKMTSLQLPEKIARDERYIEAVLYKDRVIMIGAEEPNIIELNLLTMETRVINEYFKSIERKAGSYCRSGLWLKDNIIYVSLAISREVLKLDLDDYSYEVIRIPGGLGGFAGITNDDNVFWLTPRRGGEIVKWDGKNKIEVYAHEVECPAGKCCFVGAYALGENLIFPGFEWKYTLLINKTAGKVDCKEFSFFYTDYNGDGELFGHDRRGELIILGEDYVEKHIIEVMESEWNMFLKNCGIVEIMVNNGECIKEKSLYQLDSFLNEIKN